MTNLTIRIATTEDMDDIMRLALLACAENGFLNPNPAKFATEVWPALCLDNGIVGLLCAEDGDIGGFVILRVGAMWYSDTQLLEEKVIFVHPDYRVATTRSEQQRGAAAMLCDFSKKVSDSLGLTLLIGVLSNSRTPAKIRLYERQFGQQAGAFFLYGARTDEGLGVHN